MRIYVAGGFNNKRKVRAVMQKLRDAGHEIVGDWTIHKSTRNKHVLASEVMADWSAEMKADVVVIVWPGRFNTRVELGIALGSRKMVYIIGKPDYSQDIYPLHPLVTIVGKYEDLPTYIRG